MRAVALWVVCAATLSLHRGSTKELRCGDSSHQLQHAHPRCKTQIRTPRASTASLVHAVLEPRGTSRVAHGVIQNSLACLWLHGKLIGPCSCALHRCWTSLAGRRCTDPSAAFARLILRGGRDTGHPSQGRARQAGPQVGRIFLAAQCEGITAAPNAGTRLHRIPVRGCWGKIHASACVCPAQRPTCNRKQAQTRVPTTQPQMKLCTSSSRQRHPLRGPEPKPCPLHHSGEA